MSPGEKDLKQKKDGWEQSSTSRAVGEAGRMAGRAHALAEFGSRQLAWTLGRQAKRKLGPAGPDEQATLEGLARAFAVDTLLALGDRLPASESWGDWLAGVLVPAPAPGIPEYAQNLEIAFDQSEPSIDTHAEAEIFGGVKALIHLRIQKWYQPELDKVLYESSVRLEKKHGRMPMVVVMLMWPPAEGPGMTGQYEDRDAAGRLIRKFRYVLKRAWDLTPEELAANPGAMMLAPFGNGATGRMPEVVRLIKKGLDKNQADAKTREMVWIATYWGIGLVCTLEEAHAALGDVLPVIQASESYRGALGASFGQGYSESQVEGRLIVLRELIERQSAARWGIPPGSQAWLASMTDPDVLESIAGRMLTAIEPGDLFT